MCSLVPGSGTASIAFFSCTAKAKQLFILSFYNVCICNYIYIYMVRVLGRSGCRFGV